MSSALLNGVLRKQINIALSVALAFEYEDVRTRPEQLSAARLTADEATIVLDAIVAKARPTTLRYLRRPQL